MRGVALEEPVGEVPAEQQGPVQSGFLAPEEQAAVVRGGSSLNPPITLRLAASAWATHLSGFGGGASGWPRRGSLVRWSSP